MIVRLLSGVCVVFAADTSAPGGVPRGRRSTRRRPFGEIAATASSEQADRWPASKAVDGDTSEPEGIWQTARSSPESAWLELRLRRPRRVRGVRIFHQRNPRYYRSVDYTIACRAGGAWKTVARVEGNRQAGWRAHPFEPVETAGVRVTITKSEHAARMGLNEVALDLDGAGEGLVDGRVLRESRPHRCGKVPDLGVIAFDAYLPKAAGVELSTRTAPDAGGKPGRWSDWSPPCRQSGQAVTSPVSEWIQYRAALRGSPLQLPVLREVSIGSPACIERVDLGAIVPLPGEPLGVAVRFRRPMRPGAALRGELRLAGRPVRALTGGALSEDGRTWRFSPVPLGAAAAGAGKLLLGGAETADGTRMMHEEVPLVVGTRAVLDRVDLRGRAKTAP